MNDDFGYGTGASPDPSAPTPEPEPRVNAEAKIFWNFLEKRYYVSFSYHEEFIRFLKAAIPKRARRYDPGSKAWAFGKAYLPVVEAEARRIFPDVQVEMEPPRRRAARAPRTEIPRNSRDELILEFFDALPAEAWKSAYRKAAMLMHPDRGGDVAAMTYLNSLWEEIERKIFGRK